MIRCCLAWYYAPRWCRMLSFARALLRQFFSKSGLYDKECVNTHLSMMPGIHDIYDLIFDEFKNWTACKLKLVSPSEE